MSRSTRLSSKDVGTTVRRICSTASSEVFGLLLDATSVNNFRILLGRLSTTRVSCVEQYFMVCTFSSHSDD